MIAVLLILFNFTSRSRDILNEASVTTDFNSFEIASDFETCKSQLLENSDNFLQNAPQFQDSNHHSIEDLRVLNQLTKVKNEIVTTITVMETFKLWRSHYRKQITSLNSKFNELRELVNDLPVPTESDDL